MSHTHPTFTQSNFQQIFDNALKAYKRRTRNDLRTHPLAERLNACDSANKTLGEGVGSVFSPAKAIFIGFGVLLSTTKDVRAEQDSIFEIFERIETFFRRLDIYTQVAPNEGMVDTITAIMVETLNILAIATKEIKHGRMSKSLP
ncbi:hypothetical protein BGY98DRAFT_1011371 [Russula aff. rugulosa BPL654]|nr:hypothetical protein BGY98DRAFT_1011371 [Russula aff. rugulosa BPL654]